MADPRIAVFGAGAVGCFIGGAWQAAGLDVTFIGRENVRAAADEHGMLLSDGAGWRAQVPVEVISFTTDAKAVADADIILVTVKSSGTWEAAKQIARYARKGTTVISFQNGVSNPALLAEELKHQRVLAGVVGFNVAYLGHGRWLKGTSGDLVVEDSEITRSLAAKIGSGPARLALSKDMPGVAWGKLLINLNNAVNALSGATLLGELLQRDYRRIVAAAMVEALDLLAAAKIEPAKIGPIPPRLLPHVIAAPDFIFRNVVLRVQKIDPQARSSMADDLAAGRATEIDFLNGEVVKLARSLGRDAPVNEAIVNLVKQKEAGVDRVWSPAELRGHVFRNHKQAMLFGY